MRHNYHTRAIILSRTPIGEASAVLALLTEDLGLVRARVQSVRKPSARLAHALPTFAESEVVLVRGKEGWRVTTATLVRQWHRHLPLLPRLRAARIGALLLRLAPSEDADRTLFGVMRGLLETLASEQDSLHDAAECVAALRTLSVLGLDAGALPTDSTSGYEPETLREVAHDRAALIARINKGIAASGL